MLNLSCRRLRARFTLLAVVALSALLLRSVAFAQTSVSNGSISGTVTDATGAVVPDAKVTMTGPTGQTVHSSDVVRARRVLDFLGLIQRISTMRR